VVLLGVRPVYSVQGRFLMFSAPFVCLLSLAHVIYVRDSLARSMFAHLLDPPPTGDAGIGPWSARRRRFVSEARRLTLTALPGLLVLASLACVGGYTELLSEFSPRPSPG